MLTAGGMLARPGQAVTLGGESHQLRSWSSSWRPALPGSSGRPQDYTRRDPDARLAALAATAMASTASVKAQPWATSSWRRGQGRAPNAKKLRQVSPARAEKALNH
jgi:hypothetical protein